MSLLPESDVVEPGTPILTSLDSAVLTITLNRPRAFNSFDEHVKSALLTALQRAAEDEAVRAIVITGAGSAFCAGQDLKEHLKLVAAGDESVSETVSGFYNPLAMLLTGMPKPVIAAVNGVAAGAGAAMAFACDIRLAAQSATFTMAFAGAGLSADTGASYTLPRLIGVGRTLELMLTGRKLDAEEAERIGLVSAVLPDADLRGAAQELAVRLAAGPTASFAWIKASIRTGQESDLPTTLAFENEAQRACFASADHVEGLRAFTEKRAAVFVGR